MLEACGRRTSTPDCFKAVCRPDPMSCYGQNAYSRIGRPSVGGPPPGTCCLEHPPSVVPAGAKRKAGTPIVIAHSQLAR